MVKPDIYQLTKFQFESLHKAANTKNPLMVVSEVIDTDDEKASGILRSRLEDAADLVGMGLMEDLTSEHIETVNSYKLKLGRGVRFYAITEVGFDMFNGPKEASVLH